MKESQDNARVRINSVLILFVPCFNMGSFCAITRSIIRNNFFNMGSFGAITRLTIINNFFDILSFFDFLDFY